MSDLLTANGVPVNQERLLFELGAWMNSEKVVRAILQEGLSDLKQLIRLKQRAQATMEQTEDKMTPKQTASCVLRMLSSRIVRMQIALYMSKLRHQKKQLIMKNLYQLRGWIMLEYGINEHGKPLTQEERDNLTTSYSWADNQTSREADA